MPLAKLLGEKLVAVGGARVCTREALAGASAVGLYFSASWCPPCRNFTPKLVDSYNGFLAAKGFKCVLISRDRDLNDFEAYYSKMPWLALPYEEQELNAALGSRFGVKTIPSLALVDAQGKTIASEANEDVLRDPQGVEFPWHPPLVRDLATGNPGRVNEVPSLVLLCEAATQVQQQEALAEMTILASDWAGGQQYGFFIVSGGPLAARVRDLCRLEAGGPPQLLMLDIPDGGAFYRGPVGHDALEECHMKKVLSDFEARTLERKQLGAK